MQKTRLGISVGLLGSLMFFCCLLGGFTPSLILMGYILLFEANPWLKRTSVKAFLLMIVFSAVPYVLGLIPDFINFIGNIFNIFDANFSVPVVTAIISVFTSAISILEIVVFILLGIKALRQGAINIPVVDDITNNNME